MTTVNHSSKAENSIFMEDCDTESFDFVDALFIFTSLSLILPFSNAVWERQDLQSLQVAEATAKAELQRP